MVSEKEHVRVNKSTRRQVRETKSKWFPITHLLTQVDWLLGQSAQQLILFLSNDLGAEAFARYSKKVILIKTV